MKREKVKGKGTRRVAPDGILAEYDFSRARPNKYAAHYAKWR